MKWAWTQNLVLVGSVYLILGPFPWPWQLTTGAGTIALGASIGWAESGRSWGALLGAVAGWTLAASVRAPDAILAVAATVGLLSAHRGGGRSAAAVLLATAAIWTLLEGVPACAAGQTRLDEAVRSLTRAWGGPNGVGLSFAASGGVVALGAAVAAVATGRAGFGFIAVLAGWLAGVGFWSVGLRYGWWPPAAAAFASLPAAIAIAAFPAPGRGSRVVPVSVARVLPVVLLGLLVRDLNRADAPEPGLKVAILTEGLQDYEVPTHGRYGHFAGGMFGYLPVALRAAGADVVKLSMEQFEREDLSDVDVLLLINLNRDLEERARKIHSWVSEGGRLVVLGDHTDVAGILEPTNSVISRYGMNLRFDSAYCSAPWERGWARPGAAYLRHARHEGFLPYGVGCSIALAGDAQPLLRGRFAHSDRGIELNFVGAFLGNYAIDPGEDYGDIVVAARARAGRGSVTVFGDTTPFQNDPLRRTATGFLPAILGELSRSSHWAGAIVVSVALLFIAVVILLRPRGAPVLAVVVAGAAVVANFGDGRDLTGLQNPTVLKPLLLDLARLPVDQSTKGRRWMSRWSISRTAQRAGYFVVSQSGLRPADLSRTDAILAVLPIAPVPEQESILRWIRAGGTFLFVGGPQHVQGVERILDEAGIRVDGTPMGAVPPGITASIGAPRFPSTYQLLFREGTPFEALFAWDGVVHSASVALGSGNVIVVADDSIPYGSFLEGSDGWHLGNLAFFDQIWKEVGDTGHVED